MAKKITLKRIQNSKIKWVKIVSRAHTPLFLSLMAEGMGKEYCLKSLGVKADFNNIKEVVCDKELACFLDEEQIKAFNEIIEQEKKEGLSFFRKYIKRCYKQCRALVNVAKKISKIKHFERLDNPHLLKIFKKYYREVLYLMPFLPTWRPIQAILEKSIKSSIEKILEDNKSNLTNYYFNKLFIPTRNIYLVQNLRDLLKIGAEIQKSPKTIKLFKKNPKEVEKNLPQINRKVYTMISSNTRQLGWMKIPYFYGRTPASFIDIIERIKIFLKNDCAEKLDENLRKDEKRKKEYQKVKRELNLSKKLVAEIKILNEYLYLINYRLDIFSIADFYTRSLLNEISKRIKLSYQDLIFLTYQEISKFLKAGRKINLHAFHERKKGYGLFKIHKKSRWYFGKEFKMLLRQETKKESVLPFLAEIKGNGVSLGKAKGKVKLVLKEKDINKFHNGDILITTMTTPDLILAVQKSNGIVTDEGGILCHAAIVSRELGIPCIINTKVATKVLKDGDLIEVDANVGIVKILKR